MLLRVITDGDTKVVRLVSTVHSLADHFVMDIPLVVGHQCTKVARWTTSR